MQKLPNSSVKADSVQRSDGLLQFLRIDRISAVCENPPILELLQGLHNALSAPRNRGHQIGKGVPLP